jgi:NAD(P)-dependent dehydrogenase (short-subunit alcohol dehydrogenase family)
MGWSVEDMPSQEGRIALVTGATDGLGKETALALGNKGATVIVAGRNRERGEAIARQMPSATFEPLDLASLANVRDFTARVLENYPPIDILIANAGISMPPTLQRSADGFEIQMAVNFYGHFALIAGLMPALTAASARVVTVSSVAASRGKVDPDDLDGEKGYSPMKYYALSKLATLLFGQELDRRSRENGWGITSLSAHPGFSRTNLGHSGPKLGSRGINWVGLSTTLLGPLFAQSAAAGALPSLYAATAPEAEGGMFIGPGGRGQMKGPPKVVDLPASAESHSDAHLLWRAAERATGATWPPPQA